MRHLTVAPSEGSFRAVPSIDGVERIFAYGKLGNYPLVISYTVAVRTVLAPWRWHVMIFGGAGLAAGLAVIVLALAAIKQSGRLADERASRATLEQAVLQAKRLELLGQVAAGTAHDFANILQAMRNGLTLIKHRAAQPDRVRFLADRLDEDARRGTSLTQRMLDLAHQDEPETAGDGLVSPAEVLGRVDEMLCRLLGSQYRLRCEIASADLPGSVRGDRAGLEVALMNLAINARDAMPGGGEVVIRATAEQAGDGVRASGKASGPGSGVADGEPNRPASARGGYVCISVIDTGIGMPPHVLSRAGEPFFTTKPRGRGTGLGLSGARAFAERAGGWLSIESAAGCGTTVALWLPVVVPCRAVETEPAEPMV
jgi:signal transduction histidine kinase